MNVNLGPVLDQFVAELLKTGHYQTQSEVLREGLRLLKEREERRQAQLAEIRKAIAQGIEQADRGEFVDGPAAFEKIRRRSARFRRSRK
jgi:antitoxin ParD1/3/4